MVRICLRFFLVIWLLILYKIPLLAQGRSLSISPSADSLQEILSVRSADQAAKNNLIEEYLKHSEVEMALLELLDFSEETGYNDNIHHYRGEILLGVGNYKAALKELKTSYLRNPTNEKLMNIAFSYHGLGNSELAKKIYDQLLKVDSKIDDQALIMHASLNKGNRAAVANLIPSFYKVFYPDKYIKYFPSPQLTILSPENSSTVYNEATLLFSVYHSRPVKSVELNDEVLYSSATPQDESESFSREFSSKLTIPAGAVKIKVRAMDIYGFSAEAELNLLGLGFEREAGWKSSYSDSLNAGLSFLNSFIPREITKSQKSGNTNIIVFGSGFRDGSDFQKAVFWHDLFASEQIGVTERKNIKPLLLENAGMENFRKLYEDWLIKSTNFQSRAILYINSPVTTAGNTLTILTADGNSFDILPTISSSFRIMSDGFLMILDGKIDNPGNAEKILRGLLAEAQFPAGVILTNGEDIISPVIAHILKPENISSQDKNPLLLEFSDLTEYKPSAIFLSGAKGAPSLLSSPAGKALSAHREILEQLENKLKADKIQTAQAEKIRKYCADWKMYNDILRYVRQDLSLPDLIIKIDEFNSRTGGN